VQPFGVDVCSGLRTDGRLDHTKLELFMRAVHEGASESLAHPRGL
jgi:phosphoribosylanthranilate isomerase